MLRCILKKIFAFNLCLHLLLIDIKQACDSINTTQSYKTLKEFWIPKKLVNLVKMAAKLGLLKYWEKESVKGTFHFPLTFYLFVNLRTALAVCTLDGVIAS
jgi:hypothetical protein